MALLPWWKLHCMFIPLTFIMLSIQEHIFLTSANIVAVGVSSDNNSTQPCTTYMVTGFLVCGDDICDSDHSESCSSCPGDCGRCPLSAGSISGISVSAFLIIGLLVSGLVYMKYASDRLLWDESWIVNYFSIQTPGGLNNGKNTFGSVLNIGELVNDSLPVTPQRGHNQTIPSDSVASENGGNLGLYKGELFALKRIQKKTFKLTKSIRLEVKQIRQLDHPNLMAFWGACVKLPNVMILTKYCAKGNLLQVLSAKHIPLNWAFRFSFANDIISGICYLHSHGMVHGRLKIENCLVDDRWTVRLTDFGVSSLRQAEGEDVIAEYESSALWRAPELIEGSSTELGDVYAYGLLIIQIATRCDLPADQTDNLSTVKMDWENTLTRNELGDADNRCPCPGGINSIVESCMMEKPTSRPLAVSVKKQLRALNSNKLNPVDLMMMMMEKYSKHLEMMVAERTQDLILEKQRTDQLLHAMLPKKVADDLRMGRSVNADSFDSCTIYFSDIVGFTTISGRLPAIEVVALLNNLYSCFDKLVDKYDVYKVETIGDAYMVVSGVPIRNGKEHAPSIANMALDILHESRNFVIPAMPDEPLKIRIGLHTGPVCAGVVGLKMPRYCLFGDTVNTASRMESSGEAYKIHMSNDTKQCLMECSQAHHFSLTQRGQITVKGKGEMFTWWLEGKRVKSSTEDRIGADGNYSAPLPPINVPNIEL